MSDRSVSTDETLAVLRADPERAEAILVEKLLAQAEPDVLSELLMAAALPRTFDAVTLGALVGRAPTDGEFTGAFSRLIAYPFVDERPDGQFALHDSIQQALLERWQSPSAAPGDLGEHLRRLLSHYNERYKSARNSAAALAQVGPLMRQVNPHRYFDAANRIEDMLVRPVIEALHIALVIGPDEGWQQLETVFAELEQERRYGLCEMLVNSYAEDARTVPPDARAQHAAWAAYFAARLANDRQHWEDAERYTRRVKRPEEIGLTLATRIQYEQARSLRGQGQFSEALAAIDRGIVNHDEHYVDDWRASVTWRMKADIYQQLWELDNEVRACRQGLEWATSAGNQNAAVTQLLRLVSALDADGDVNGAARCLLDALRQARLRLTEDRFANRDVARVALQFLGPRSARLLAAISSQYRRLSQSEWPFGSIDVLLDKASAIAAGGGAGSAVVELYREAHRLAVEHAPEQVWDVEVRWAVSSDVFGERLAVVERNRALLTDPIPAVDPWTRAYYLTSVARGFLAAGKYHTGLEWVRAARRLWASIGHRRAVGVTHALEAELLRRLGDFDGAQQALTAAGDAPARGYEARQHAFAARLALDLGDYKVAAAESQRATRASVAIDRLEATDYTLLAIECLMKARSFDQALHRAETDLRRQLADLSAFTTWKPTKKTQLADEHAARAVDIVVEGRGPLSARRRSAREHLDMAVELDPDLGWFRLERAFVDLQTSRKRDAMQCLTEAAERTSDPVLRTAIEALRAE